MTLESRPISPLVVDTSAKIYTAQATGLYDAGVHTVIRYVFFSVPRPGDLDAGELAILTDAGLTVVAVQHVRYPGWWAGGDEGAKDALAGIVNAQKAGYVVESGPPLSLALDMEGVGNPGSDAFAHADTWCRGVRAAGYAPLVYVGYDSGLDAAALDSIGGEPAFWCDYAPVNLRPAPTVGYVLHQQTQRTVAGVGVDPDTILQDGRIYGLARAA